MSAAEHLTEPTPVGRLTEKAAAAFAAAERSGRIAADEPEPSDADLGAERWARFAPHRFTGAHLGGIDRQLERDLRCWVDGDRRGNLLLRGPVGTGKTHAAFAVCRELIDRGVRPTWVPVVDALDDMRPDGDPTVLPRLCHAPVLFLDDLGGERPTDWTAERLYRVVNTRWLEGRPTIATTNVGGDDLAEVVGERVVSRLVDGATIVQVAGEDRRRPA